jgi:hypothetical protein
VKYDIFLIFVVVMGDMTEITQPILVPEDLNNIENSKAISKFSRDVSIKPNILRI